MRNNHGRKERALFLFCLPTTEPEFPIFVCPYLDASTAQEVFDEPVALSADDTRSKAL
jgi:hypothetical protein